jgi:prepilin-type N-terminal cleavage/methylation domain-containing protein
MSHSMRKRWGFTLIELLIVVAIIAILAAIAVPNFMEAQTRSKVSRCKSDMRSCVTALEAYAVDTNNYPFPYGYENSGGILEVIDCCDESFEGFLPPQRLTTPVAYMTSLPLDIFKVEQPDEHPLDVPFHYSEQRTNENMATPEPTFLSDLYFTLTASKAQPRYLLFSHGPCLKHIDGSEPGNPPILYDSTNGTRSQGNIYYFGPGSGFKN